MKYKVWNEESKYDNEEDVYYFSLKDVDGSIVLICVDKFSGEKLKNGTICVLDNCLKCLILTDSINDKKIRIKTDYRGSTIAITEKDYNELKRESMLHQLDKSLINRLMEQEKDDSTLQ